MNDYKLDTCGPMYITIGDGGNIEGPYRNYVDEINPATNATVGSTTLCIPLHERPVIGR